MTFPLLSAGGIGLLDLPVPAVELGPPSEDRRAYWTVVQTTTGLPRFPPVRNDRGGCCLYSGVVVSTHGTQGSRAHIDPLSPRQPSVATTGVDGPSTAVHLRSPVRSSPRPMRLDGSDALGLHPSAFARFVTWRLQGSGIGLDTGQGMTTSHARSSWCNIASRAPHNP